jgi:hypothetical protein
MDYCFFLSVFAHDFPQCMFLSRFPLIMILVSVN